MFEKGYWSLEEALKEAREDRAIWVSPAFVKEKLFGYNEFFILGHKQVKKGVRILLQTTVDEKLTVVDRPDSYWRKLMTSLEVKDYPDLRGKKLLVSFKIVHDRAYVDRMMIPPSVVVVPCSKKQIAS